MFCVNKDKKAQWFEFFFFCLFCFVIENLVVTMSENKYHIDGWILGRLFYY